MLIFKHFPHLTTISVLYVNMNHLNKDFKIKLLESGSLLSHKTSDIEQCSIENTLMFLNKLD